MFFHYFGLILILDAFSDNLAKDVLKVGVLWPAFSVSVYLNFYISDTVAKYATVNKCKAIFSFWKLISCSDFLFQQIFSRVTLIAKIKWMSLLEIRKSKRPSDYHSGKPPKNGIPRRNTPPKKKFFFYDTFPQNKQKEAFFKVLWHHGCLNLKSMNNI